MYGYIYKITNLLDGKVYIGKHKYDKPVLDEKYITSGILINRCIDKYGIENFTREIVCICQSLVELNEQEKYYIKYFNSMHPNGYNLTSGGDGISEPTQQILEANRAWHKGRPQTPESNKKRSDTLKGRPHSLEWVDKIRCANKGQIPSKQTIEASSKRHKNTHWYNDGVNEFMLFECDVTPDLKRGRLKK